MIIIKIFKGIVNNRISIAKKKSKNDLMKKYKLLKIVSSLNFSIN